MNSQKKKKNQQKVECQSLYVFFFFPLLGELVKKKSEHSNAKQFFLGPQNGREREKNFEFTEGC